MLQGPITFSLEAMLMFLGLFIGLVVFCIVFSYYIARSRWRTMMELRERHSPSRKPDHDDEWLHE